MKIIEWKPIKGYEGLYEISNTGKVRSLDHLRKTDRSSYVQKGKELKLGLNKKTGYLMVSLSKEGKTKSHTVHKLVAKTFIENPNNYSCINHKDENKQNNHISNLEFCTKKYNCNYGTRGKKISEKLSKRINQYTMNDEYIKTWNSSVEIEKILGIDQSNVCLCCKGKRKSVGGFKWEYMI